jgi:serine/threonine protein kinase
LLDAQGNLIVTDFGFANQFSPVTGDLMSTSCGSPCYAAPELVMTGNLYSGKATDIWSSGVILYAMLCGYLPFDDDIKNPNDNVGRLYRYIMVNKPKYPHRLSDGAKDIIGKMLVPDPSKRSKIEEIMAHPWLYEYADLFSKTIEELEMEAQLVKQILLRYTLSPEPSCGNSEYCSSCCESRVSDISSSSSSLASSSYSYKAKNEIGIGAIQEPTEKVNVEDPIKDDLQEEEQLSQQQKDRVIDSSDDDLVISQTSSKKEHEPTEIIEEYQIKQEDEIEDEIIPIAPIRHDNSSVHAVQELPTNGQTGVTAPYVESEGSNVQKQLSLNKTSITNAKSSVQIEQTNNKPSPGNTSLRAKIFSSVRMRPQKQSKATKQDKKNDVNKEKTIKQKNKRNSWQALMHHDHSFEVSAPTPQQTKSTGFISWLKNKTHHKSSKFLLLDIDIY